MRCCLVIHTLVCIDSYAMQAQSVKQCVEHRPLRAAGRVVGLVRVGNASKGRSSSSYCYQIEHRSGLGRGGRPRMPSVCPGGIASLRRRRSVMLQDTGSVFESTSRFNLKSDA
jgi:hypothetical protein